MRAVDHGAATVDDIRHIAFAFVGGGAEEGSAQAADDARGVVEVEQDGAEAVFAHGADAVGDDEPAGFGFDGGAAIAELDEFPGLFRPDQHLRLIPKVQVVREQKKRSHIFTYLNWQRRGADEVY